MLSILLVSNYLKREQLAKDNQRTGRIRNASWTDAEFLVGAVFLPHNVRQYILALLSTSYRSLYLIDPIRLGNIDDLYVLNHFAFFSSIASY